MPGFWAGGHWEYEKSLAALFDCKIAEVKDSLKQAASDEERQDLEKLIKELRVEYRAEVERSQDYLF